ncbi:MAG: NAD-dependent deacylase [Ignavibacteriaceae bacterium]|nr:NAD-dependent deacylase [Ignavibacteriaceae bacterium]
MLDIKKSDIEKIKNAGHVVFFSGAGMSQESGIATFRGKDGIWNKFKPEELANINGFMKNPDMVWEWYKYRHDIVRNAEPNQGHIAIAEFQKYLPKVTVITQNIDNLHKRAGSKNIFELHGNIERNYCMKCKTFYNEINEIPEVPKCRCGGLIRPDVVWFGEYLPQDQFQGAELAASNCDIFFVVGTSAVVYPAASLIYTAKDCGAIIFEINIEKTDISILARESFIGKAGNLLPMILKEIKE